MWTEFHIKQLSKLSLEVKISNKVEFIQEQPFLNVEVSETILTDLQIPRSHSTNCLILKLFHERLI